jgi:VWFA-related protein
MAARARSWSVLFAGCLLSSAAGMGAWGVLVSARTPFEDRSVLVTVLDDQNRPVKDLTATEIVVREDGAAREVTAVTPATDAMCVALLVDTTKPRQGSQAPTRDLRTGLTNFVRTVKAGIPDAEFALMEFAGAAVMTENFTTTAADVERRIGRLFPSQQVSAVLMEALVDVSQSISKRPCTRRAIVSIDLDSQEASELPGQKIGEAVQRAGAALWAISIQRGPTNASGAQRNVVLNALAEITGGLRLSIVEATALDSVLQKIAGALTSQYLVTYKRPDGATVTQIRATSPKGKTVLATRLAAQ